MTERLDRERLDEHGYAWAPRRLTATDWYGLGPTAPIRDVLATASWLREIALGPTLRDIASEALGAPAFAVRANLFAKTEGSNWSVPWHRDCAVCVRERHATPGFTAWTIKGGLHHANAPFEVLSNMVGLRLHLDACDADTGALEVVAGSHREIATDKAEVPPTKLNAEAGEVLVMRPLLLHRSRSQRTPRSRRVLHVEFAAQQLPEPLSWHYVDVA